MVRRINSPVPGCNEEVWPHVNVRKGAEIRAGAQQVTGLVDAILALMARENGVEFDGGYELFLHTVVSAQIRRRRKPVWKSKWHISTLL